MFVKEIGYFSGFTAQIVEKLRNIIIGAFIKHAVGTGDLIEVGILVIFYIVDKPADYRVYVIAGGLDGIE